MAGGKVGDLRRTKGSIVRQSPNAALPTNSSPEGIRGGVSENGGRKKNSSARSRVPRSPQP